jgi:E3 ubiquitin-protein ligase HERC2
MLSRWREYLYSRSKSEIFVQALQSSQTAGQAFELTISRSKALRFGARGQTDKEGRWSIFGQIFRAVQGLSPSVLRRSDQLWKVLLAGERAQDAGGPYRESWTLMCAELMSSTLSLFVPCANARNAVGNNRDAWILNPLCTSPIESQMLQFFGKLMGAAVRSQQFMDLTIAPFAWKMIVGLMVGA